MCTHIKSLLIPSVSSPSYGSKPSKSLSIFCYFLLFIATKHIKIPKTRMITPPIIKRSRYFSINEIDYFD